jgi:CMP-N,N'-diacetyllegionaminic acid synthase
MISGHRVIALTPARGGSKSIPYKNLQLLGGRTLLSWPIECAINTPEIDRIIVSTDDDRIAKTARECGAEVYWRPADLATDHALVIDVLRHLWAQLRSEGEDADILVLLEATSPFRSPELISHCLLRMINEGLDSIATFSEAEVNPERTWIIEKNVPTPFISGAIPWKPRQLLTPAYQLNGAVYALYPDRLPGATPSILFGNMGAEIISANSTIDIDTSRDIVIANAILQS